MMSMVTKPPMKPQQTHDEEQLRRDRTTAIMMLIVLGAIFALIVWLASLGNGNGSLEHYDYWSVPF